MDTKLKRFGDEIKFNKLGVDTKLKRFGDEIKFNKLGVDTKLKRFGVEIKFNKLGVEINPERVAEERYPAVPNPTTVETKFACDNVPLPRGPNAVEKLDIEPANVELSVNVET